MIISLNQRFLQIVESFIIRLSVTIKGALLQDVFVLCKYYNMYCNIIICIVICVNVIF